MEQEPNKPKANRFSTVWDRKPVEQEQKSAPTQSEPPARDSNVFGAEKGGKK